MPSFFDKEHGMNAVLLAAAKPEFQSAPAAAIVHGTHPGLEVFWQFHARFLFEKDIMADESSAVIIVLQQHFESV